MPTATNRFTPTNRFTRTDVPWYYQNVGGGMDIDGSFFPKGTYNPFSGMDIGGGTPTPLGAAPVPGGENILFPYSSPAPTTAGLPEALATARSVNAANLDYLGMGIPGYENLSGQMSGEIGRLLDPNDPTANYDVASQAAEDASMMGIVGSPLASSRANQRRQLDVERRATLADRLLSGAAGRLPQPYDISRDLITPYQREQIRQQQEELDFRRLSEQERLRLQGEELGLRRLGLNRSSQPRGGAGGGGSGTPTTKPAGTPSTQSTGRSIQNLLDTYVDRGPGWGRTWSTEAQPTGGANLGSATPDFGLNDMDFTLGGLFDFPGSPYDTSYGGLVPPTDIMDMAFPTSNANYDSGGGYGGEEFDWDW